MGEKYWNSMMKEADQDGDGEVILLLLFNNKLINKIYFYLIKIIMQIIQIDYNEFLELMDFKK